ncbi:MAG: hypothetical protein ABJB39_04610, partial [Chloroflexota bacterium]
MREPRTTKSFRDAGDRIVRQESVLPPSVNRLLGAPAPAARRSSSDADAWDVRLTALATLAQYDAVACVTDGADGPAAYNLASDPVTDPAIRAAVDEAARTAVTSQLRVSLRLADGRVASAALVTPLAPSDTFTGALVVLRVGRPFAAVDAYTAVGIAEIVSLELERGLAARSEATDRRDALVLYELARCALFIEDLDETLQAIAMLIARTLDHDAAQVWIRHADRSLRRHAAYPVDQSASPVLWENTHDALFGALHDRRLVRASSASVPWMPSNTKEVLVVPLRGEP